MEWEFERGETDKQHKQEVHSSVIAFVTCQTVRLKPSRHLQSVRWMQFTALLTHRVTSSKFKSMQESIGDKDKAKNLSELL